MKGALLLLIALARFTLTGATGSSGGSWIDSSGPTGATTADEFQSSCKQPNCHWNRGQPNNGEGNGEAVLYILKGRSRLGFPIPGWTNLGWIDFRDQAYQGYLCQLPTNRSTEDGTESGSSSSLGPTSSNNSSLLNSWSYEVFEADEPISQTEAAQKCQEKGGYLGTVTSVEDEAQVGLALDEDVKDQPAEFITGGHMTEMWTQGNELWGTWVWKYGPPAVVGKTIWKGKYPPRGYSWVFIFCVLGGLTVVAPPLGRFQGHRQSTWRQQPQ